LSSEAAGVLWHKAVRKLRAAETLFAEGDYGSASGLAYFAAFNAVSALFLLEGRDFRKHSQIQSAVSVELARKGRWPDELARGFRKLGELRAEDDYETAPECTETTGMEALRMAEAILRQVSRDRPDLFILWDDDEATR